MYINLVECLQVKLTSSYLLSGKDMASSLFNFLLVFQELYEKRSPY